MPAALASCALSPLDRHNILGKKCVLEALQIYLIMTLIVKPPTGENGNVDVKVAMADGTVADVQRLMIKTSESTLETVYERVASSSQLPPLPGVDPFMLTVNAHDGEFIIPTSGAGTLDWIVDWGDDVVTRVRTLSDTAHNYKTPGTYQIKVYPSTASATAWLKVYGFSGYNDNHPAPETGANSLANRQKVIHVDGKIVPKMIATAAEIAANSVGNGVCGRWFFGCTNLTMSDDFTFSGWENITAVGGQFCYEMFRNCSGNQFKMGRSFNLPQNIRTIGRNSAHVSINVQQEAHAFCLRMFQDCSGSSFTMNDVFTLPQTLIMTGAHFCVCMFRSCRGAAFMMGESFNLPQNITKIQEPEVTNEYGHVFESMFSSCSGKAFTMNKILNMPQGLRHGHLLMGARMFYNCSGNAFTMNALFNLPQVMTNTGNGLAYQMFAGCRGNAFTMNKVFRIPPHLIEKVYSAVHFFSQTFYGCSGSAFQVNSVLVFKTLSAAELDIERKDSDGNATPRGAYRNTFSGCTTPQTRTAASIIGNNPTPTQPHNTFGTGFPDWNSIDPNWRG